MNQAITDKKATVIPMDEIDSLGAPINQATASVAITTPMTEFLVGLLP